ncbi:MAG: anaerobic ribonucleoside-triphosphate reductase activating protein [Firmicutes bacterium]|nr:anaerobic ribonucleoside-triphosphate reductase activating protein [Candidatus Alectryobacillus merdavium]
MSKIRIAGYVDDSIVDGPGIRFTIFTQGCAHHCFNCHNPETWAFDKGKDVDIDELISKIKRNPLLQGITLSGGDPLYQVDACLELVKKVKELNSDLDIIIYTGFTFEELANNFKKNNDLLSLLKLSDILIDGKYEDSLRDLTLRFRGSSNQRVINLKKTFLEEKIVLENW